MKSSYYVFYCFSDVSIRKIVFSHTFKFVSVVWFASFVFISVEKEALAC